MNKDEALRLALEALKELKAVMPIFPKDGECIVGYKDRYNAAQYQASNAITAIKQALANDALDKMAENERELGIQMQPEPPCKTGSQCTSKCEECAEPEPVAQVVMYSVIRALKPLSFGTLLYTSPPKREPEPEPVAIAEGKYLYWRLHSLSKCLESSGRIDEHDCEGAYATILDAMNVVMAREAAHGIKENT